MQASTGVQDLLLMCHMQRQPGFQASSQFRVVDVRGVRQFQAQSDDPRLKWARPEWLKQQQDSTRPSQTHNDSKQPSLLKPKQQAMLNRVTYGSYSSSDSDSEARIYNSNGSENCSWSEDEDAEYPVLYQALGIDFGAQRVGVAVRRSNHNMPLLTLHRQQQHYHAGAHAVTSSIASTKQQRKQQQQNLLSLRRTAAVVLHLAMREGCDGVILGLPVYTDKQQQVTFGAAAAAKQQGERRLNAIIQTFAQHLADLAGPLHLPVLLVNEQQTSQQARAVMSGAAAYDVHVTQELAVPDTHAVPGKHPQLVNQQQQEQQQLQQSKRLLQQENNRIGRDAFAAALILSRYYNGLVTPLKQVQPKQQPLHDSSHSSSSSSRDTSGSTWGEQQQQQAAADLQLMMVSPGERRRRQQQRQKSITAHKAASLD